MIKKTEEERKASRKTAAEKYRKNNKNKIREEQKERYKKNKKEILKYMRKYNKKPEIKLKNKISCKNYYQKNKKNSKVNNRKNHLKRNYNLTIKEYNKILKKQGGVCAICRNKGNGKALSVDHNHQTGKIRGLICSSCNLTLGYAKENVDRLENCIEYLNFYREVRQ